MFEGIWQALVSPQRLFTDFTSKTALLKQAFWVVLLVAIISAIGAYLSALPVVDALGEDNPFRQVGLILPPLSVLFISFIIWIINGLFIRMAAGIELKPWAMAAYTLAPSLLIGVLLIVLAALFPAKLTPISFNANDPASMQSASLAVQTEFQKSFLGLSSLVLNYLATAWSVVLIFLGVKANANTNKAIVAASLIAGLTIAFSILPLFLGSSL